MTQWWPWRPDVRPSSFAVIGIGRFGGAVCEELLNAGAEVLAIDSNQRAIEELRQVCPGFEARVVDCTDEEALRASGALDVDTVVVAIKEPLEVSITATLIVKEGRDSQVRQVIARATSTLHERMLQRVGADRVVFPSRMQGSRLGRELVRPNLLERLRLDDSNGIEEITVPPAFVGQSLRDLNLRRNHQVTVLAAGPANRLTFNPPASTVLGQGELLVVMGSYKALEALPSA
jgi:trk system potassium uptake protein TrkA